MPQIFDMTEKVALVTGAARGIGKTLANGLAEFGCDLAILDLERKWGQTSLFHYFAFPAAPIPSLLPINDGRSCF